MAITTHESDNIRWIRRCGVPGHPKPECQFFRRSGTENIWRSKNVTRSFRPLVTAKGPKTTRSDTCWDGRSKKYRGPNISILLKLTLSKLEWLLPKKSGVSFSGSFSRQNKRPHETFAIEKTDLGVSWPGRNWPTGPSERQLPTGGLAQMALEANWEAKTKLKFVLVRSREKLGF